MAIAFICFCPLLQNASLANSFPLVFLLSDGNFAVGNKNIVETIYYTRNYKNLIPMFVVGFLQFLMVRIVDEFKDYDEDCKCYKKYL